MNLLLLLSALLSALTGASGVVRAPASAQTARLLVASTERAAALPRTGAVRPEQPVPALVASADAPAVPAMEPRAPVPLYASRRRE